MIGSNEPKDPIEPAMVHEDEEIGWLLLGGDDNEAGDIDPILGLGNDVVSKQIVSTK